MLSIDCRFCAVRIEIERIELFFEDLTLGGRECGFLLAEGSYSFADRNARPLVFRTA